MAKPKIKSEIIKLDLNAATFTNVSLEPTLVNYFYGKNGVGKSTIGREILSDNGVQWVNGKSYGDFSILIYSDDFIKRNFSNYENLPGVFSIGEEDIEDRKQIDEKTIEKRAQEDLRIAKLDEYQKKQAELNATIANFKTDSFSSVRNIRDKFSKALSGSLKSEGFAKKLLEQTTAVEHEITEITTLYEIAFDDNAIAYSEMANVESDSLSEPELLSKAIVSSSNSTFAEFVKKYQTGDWLKQGHDRFQHTDGKCPYCQQVLPTNFEDEITTIFDEQFQENIEKIKSARESYKSTANAIYATLDTNSKTEFKKIDLTSYNDKFRIFSELVRQNLEIFDKKLKEPTLCLKLQDTSEILAELDTLIESYNDQIKLNNVIANSKPQKKNECTKMIWELIYFNLQSQVKTYKDSLKQINVDIEAVTVAGKAAKDEVTRLSHEIATLNQQSVNTTNAVNSINSLLRDSGFQGFSLQPKKNVPNVYEIVREDGQVAVNLSEGEQNFIAFLYFYHLVHGSDSEDGNIKDKIIVIDDPVSSMDSGALFIVSSLTRGMIEICRNNASLHPEESISTENFIKQIFILTHNTYFHNEITSNMVKYWDSVSFFIINKIDNKSSIRCCIKEIKMLDETKYENINPVQNGYNALWTELKELESPIAVVHVIHQILDHYFIQLCCYDGHSVRDRILKDNKDKFVRSNTDGTENFDDYHSVQSMLSYLSLSKDKIVDGQHFVDYAIDVTQCKEIFRKIFELMEQEQHYNMMMGIS